MPAKNRQGVFAILSGCIGVVEGTIDSSIAGFGLGPVVVAGVPFYPAQPVSKIFRDWETCLFLAFVLLPDALQLRYSVRPMGSL